MSLPDAPGRQPQRCSAARVLTVSDASGPSASLACMEATVPRWVLPSCSWWKRVVLPASQGPTSRMRLPLGPDSQALSKAAGRGGRQAVTMAWLGRASCTHIYVPKMRVIAKGERAKGAVWGLTESEDGCRNQEQQTDCAEGSERCGCILRHGRRPRCAR